MNYKNIILFGFCLFSISHAQSPLTQVDDEIFIGTENVTPTDKELTFFFEAVGDVWFSDRYWEYWQITSDYDDGSYTTTGNTGNYGTWSGWDHYNSDEGAVSLFAQGKYKIWCNDPDYPKDSLYFYIDFRDCNYYGDYSFADVWIKYDEHVKDYYYSINPPSGWDTIINFETLTIWDIQSETRETLCFISKPTNLGISTSNNHPYLTWNHDQDPDASYTYEIWRNLSQTKVPSGTWDSVNTTTNLNYLDSDVYIGDGSWGNAFYKVRAVIEDINTKSEYSNIPSIAFEGMQKNLNNSFSKCNYTNNLGQNNPNPFNPVTNISYSLAQKCNVSLMIYNNLAQVVAELMDEVQEEGYYTVPFNASNLPSGIYFYKLETDYFTDVKKMIVTK